MYEYSKTLPVKLSGLKSSLLLEILENGLKQDLFEESYFMEYLQSPARDNYSIQRVAPENLLKKGYHFKYSNVNLALMDLLKKNK